MFVKFYMFVKTTQKTEIYEKNVDYFGISDCVRVHFPGTLHYG